MPDTGRDHVGKHPGTRLTSSLPYKNLDAIINSIISYLTTVKNTMKEKYRKLN